MRRPESSLLVTKSLAILLAILLFAGGALAATEKVLYSFKGGSDGTNPSTGLIADQAGNLYGTTTDGGTGPCTGGCGTVFQLTPPGAPAGDWTETVIYNFQADKDGAGPMAGLVMDQAGNLYGTTLGGGAFLDGTAFQLTPPAAPDGAWTETVIHTFSGSPDGEYPVAPMIFDSAGNLYGTTVFGGGQSSLGTVFQLMPPAAPGGAWTETVLYRFTGRNDGLDPEAGLIMDRNGALYGTTIGDTVFKLTPPPPGQTAWTLKVLYSFTGGGDRGPLSAGNLLAGNGVLYGTQKFGGSRANAGTVFQLTPPAQGGPWTETPIHKFAGGRDGAYPLAGVITDRQGNLYGTTSGGGASGNGTVFKLTPPAAPGASWTETILHSFAGGSDGSGPGAGLIFGKGGALYSTTAGGGALGKGTVFKVVP
jgi:uncharacterized repeat protein (TIGR03803 family)